MARKILWPFQQPDTVIINYKERDAMNGIAAGNGTTDKVSHDVTAAGLFFGAGCIWQLSQNRAGDAARRKRQRRLFVKRQWLGPMIALIGQRSTIQRQSFGKST